MVQKLIGRTLQGSVFAYRTFWVEYCPTEHFVWFSIICAEPFVVQDRQPEPCIVQFYWTEPIIVQHYCTKPFMVFQLLCRTLIGSVSAAEPKIVLQTSFFFRVLYCIVVALLTLLARSKNHGMLKWSLLYRYLLIFLSSLQSFRNFL